MRESDDFAVIVRTGPGAGECYLSDNRPFLPLPGTLRKLRHDRQGEPYIVLYGEKRRVHILEKQ